jgi:hypothetical protein
MKLLSICVPPSSVASVLLFEIFFSALCYQFPSVFVLRLDRQVKLHIHTKQQIQIYCILLTCLSVKFVHLPDPKMMQVAASLGLQQKI